MKFTQKLFSIAFTCLILSCSSTRKTTSVASGDGSSFEKAVIVKNVSEEYAYVRKVCQDCKFKKQTLSSKGKKFYDLLYFDNNGTEVIYYFDINSFFGKRY